MDSRPVTDRLESTASEEPYSHTGCTVLKKLRSASWTCGETTRIIDQDLLAKLCLQCNLLCIMMQFVFLLARKGKGKEGLAGS